MRIFVSVFVLLMLYCVPAQSEPASPLKLSIKADKTAYKEGDSIKILYSVENTSDKPVNYFDPRFNGSIVSDANGNEIRHIYRGYQTSSYLGLAKNIVLQPGEKIEGEEILGQLKFDEIKENKIRFGKGGIIPIIEYSGFFVSVLGANYMLDDIQGGGVIVSGKYCTTKSNPHNYDSDMCDNVPKGGFIDLNSDPFDVKFSADGMDKQAFCANYKQFGKDFIESAYEGCVESASIEIKVDFTPPVEDGMAKDYYDNGKVKRERMYQGGVLNGETKYYYRAYYSEFLEKALDDLQKSEDEWWAKFGAKYANNERVKKGRKKSLEKQKERTIKSHQAWPAYGVRNYVNGKLHGEAKDIFDNEQLAHVWNFIDGKVDGIYKSFTRDGVPLVEANLNANGLNGMAKAFFESGNIRYAGNYKDGKLHGKVVHYSKNQRKSSEAMYADGELDGLSMRYYESGPLRSEALYKNGNIAYLKLFDKMGNIVYHHEYNCGEDAKKKYTGMPPVEALSVINNVKVNDEGVSIELKKEFKERYKDLSAYVSPFFKNGVLNITRKDNLSKYRIEGLKEEERAKSAALLAAYKDKSADQGKEPNVWLYFAKFRDNLAVFIVKKQLSTGEKKGYSYMYVNKQFTSINKCGDDYVDIPDLFESEKEKYEIIREVEVNGPLTATSGSR